MAASMAASAVLIDKRESGRAARARPPPFGTNFTQGVTDATAENVTQVCASRSSGLTGVPCAARVGGTGADHAPDRADPRGDHRTVGQRADAHRHVDVIVQQADVAVRQGHAHIDLGKPPQEVAGTTGRTCSRPKTIGAVIVSSPRGSEYSPAAWASASLTCSRMRLQAARYAAPASVRTSFRVVADQQLGVQMRLQLRHLAAERREFHSKLAARRGETSFLDRGDEDRHGFEPVHVNLSFIEVMSIRIRGLFSIW